MAKPPVSKTGTAGSTPAAPAIRWLDIHDAVAPTAGVEGSDEPKNKSHLLVADGDRRGAGGRPQSAKMKASGRTEAPTPAAPSSV